MVSKQKNYIPALRYGWLTVMFDPLIRWTLPEHRFKSRLLEQAKIEEPHRVLDLGCGTALLALLIKKTYRGARVFGIDADPRILEIARAKINKVGLEIALVQGLAYELPYPPDFFDRVLSSLVFHHLSSENKRRVANELFRVLRPGGEVHIADWGEAQNPMMRTLFLAVQLLDGFKTTADNVKGKLMEPFQEEGFVGCRETSRQMTILGTLSFYQARKP